MRTSTDQTILAKPLLDTEVSERRTSSCESLTTEMDQSFEAHHTPRRSQWLLYILMAGYVPVLALSFSFYLRCNGFGERGSGGGSVLFPGLAKSQALIYENRPLNVKIRGNPFAGDPSPTLDAAWHELFENTRMRVSQEDLDFYNLTSIPLLDGTGYAAELGVHHELHCLKKIRHWIYKDYYLVNETKDELIEWKSHINDCIGLLRETIMCRGDPSLSTFKWLPRIPLAFTAVAEGHHRCVNWDSLLAWVRENSVSIFEDGVLQLPA